MDDLIPINVGLAPNDKRGDSPRAAWLKQVANNRALAAGVSAALDGARAAVDSATVDGIRDATKPGRDLLRAQTDAAVRAAAGLDKVVNLAPADMPISEAQGRAIDAVKNYAYPLPRAFKRTIDGKLGDAAPTPYDFVNLVQGGDWTFAIQAGLDESAKARLPLAIFRAFPVGSVSAPRFSSIHSEGGSLYGIATGAANSVNAIFEMPNGNIIINGLLNIDAKYNLAYRRGVHNFGQQIQFSFLTNISVNGCQVGYTHGSEAYPYGIASETTVTGLHTYGCPISVEVIGTETIVHFVGCQLISDTFGAPLAWATLPRRVVRSIGAAAYFHGGEACITDTVNGYVAEMQPLNSTRPTIEGTRYGSVRFLGSEMETASPFLLAYNPRGLAVNQPASRALFSIDQNGGFVGQDRVMSYIADDCPIDILEGSHNRFQYPGGKKVQPTWFVDGTSGKAHVYASSHGLGPNFPDPVDAVINGVVHWPGERTILRARNPGAQSIVAGQPSTLVFVSLDTGPGLQRFLPCYSTTSGRFTAPIGDLADVQALAKVRFTDETVSGRLILVDQGGAELGSSPIVSGVASLAVDVGPMKAGQWIAVRALTSKDAVTASDSTGGGYLSGLTLKARN